MFLNVCLSAIPFVWKYVCVSVCVFVCVPKMVTLCSEEPENDLIWIASVILKIEVVLKNLDAQM